ncbi:MAG: DNA-3-methyladenine glycosylase 2 family protein [Cyanobacteria bacterium REEB446]|nr:DNA-3-methyladenine glycosylase 2 family protein [Cyanobacteria bacterium REEB446]
MQENLFVHQPLPVKDGVLPDYWSEACIKLAETDTLMADLINQYPESILSSRRDPFYTLLRAIIGQQISVKSADSMWSRLENFNNFNFSPEFFLKADSEELRSLGLSRQKVEYIKNISSYFYDKQINDDYFKNKSSSEISAELIKIKGVGTWTIEMFLIFYALEPDIFPVKDIGVINTMKKLYGFSSLDEILKHSERWRPWSTVAVWYIWRSLDDEPVLY